MKKIGLLCLVILLALGSVGAAYASWYKILYMDLTVNTGTIDAYWTTGDSWTDGDPKAASYINCWVDPDDNQVLIVEVWNAFPCVHYYQNIDFHYTGTVPAHVCDWVVPDLPYCMTLDLPDWPCTQVHEGGYLEGRIHIHFCQETAQGANYSFAIELPLVQYNKSCPQY